MMKRNVFFISDGTGITASHLGNSLLTQFEGIEFDQYTIPYVDTIDKAHKVAERINNAYQRDGYKPLIFATIVNPEVHQILSRCDGVLLDFFQTFIGPLETELHQESSHTIGRTHGVKNYNQYMLRINAVNFALASDDGVNHKAYDQADVILVGVSRCGKTPTCLYLALHHGLYAANYPFTIEDMGAIALPKFLRPHKPKLFGLTIEPERLQQIRQERRPNSDYASLNRCQKEVKEVENLLRQEQIPFVNTTTRSIEEIAAEIVMRGK